jgi:mycothiol synthase
MRVPSRPYAGEDDLQKILALLSEAWLSYGPQTYLHAGDVFWRGRNPAWMGRLMLWEEESGELAAFACLDPPSDFEFQVHPAYYRRGIEEQILDWGEEACRPHASEGAPPEPATWGSEGDHGWIDLLARRGYARAGDCCVHMLRELGAPAESVAQTFQSAEPSLPEGFVVRQLLGEQEVEARVAVHRAAFAPSRLTTDAYLHMMRSPGYRRELDVVAVAPDGALAAFCLCWIDERARVGELEPVGTHPDQQRMGLGLAVVAEGLRRLQALGATRALVCTGEQSHAAVGLYQRAGFRIDRRDYRYVKRAP